VRRTAGIGFCGQYCSYCTPQTSCHSSRMAAYFGTYTPTTCRCMGHAALPPFAAFSAKVTECVDAVASWMKSNRLQLNSGKTEVLWCTTNRRQHQLPTAALKVDGVPVPPVASVRDLGIYIDADLVMRTHVQRTVSRCFAGKRSVRLGPAILWCHCQDRHRRQPSVRGGRTSDME